MRAMLQPRIPLRTLQCSCRSLPSLFHRGYAQVVEHAQTDPGPQFEPFNFAASKTRDAPIRGEMALRRYTPRTPGVRHLVRPINDHIYKGRPLHKLTFPKKGHGKAGRNNTGHVTVRHRGGGHKRRIRTVDFSRVAPGEHVVERIEHDPNRTAHIALVNDRTSGKSSYILAAEGMREGDVVQSYRSGLPQELLDSMGGQVDVGVMASKTAHRGNCLPLGMIPVGTPIFNIALDKDGYGKYCRSAGTHGIIVAKGEDTVQREMIMAISQGSDMDVSSLSPEDLRKFERAAKFVTVKLSSGEVRLIDKEAVATIGVASNINYQYTQLGKAGRKRWLGIRPTVRGLAMNAMDHPHGGGRGKSKGNVIPKSPWGLPAKSGYKTRSKHKIDQMIVVQRPRNQGKRRRGYA